jgi:hypothetical protein
MVKAFKESHKKDVERLAADRRREAESKEAHALKNAPKHTVLCMKGLTSPVWTLGMFQMVSGDSCHCMKRTNQTRLVILQFGIQYAQCQDVDLWPNIRTLPIWRITMSQLELITKNLFRGVIS